MVSHARPVIITPRVVAPGRFGYRSVSPVVVVGRGPRVITPRVNFSPLLFNRPYYAFQPRVRIGSGFSIGYPVAYSYGYYNPYYFSAFDYAYPSYPVPAYAAPVYPYPQSAYPSFAPGTVTAQPGLANAGGASFEISPGNAEVLVDGVSMGFASQFTPTTAPLGLTPGHHHFEIRASGFQTLTFDADIVSGEVTPFQGTMDR